LEEGAAARRRRFAGAGWLVSYPGYGVAQLKIKN
jgi:hypothetical protein